MAYRVDVFGNTHAEHRFDVEEQARKFAKRASKYGIVFLTKETNSSTKGYGEIIVPV